MLSSQVIKFIYKWKVCYNDHFVYLRDMKLFQFQFLRAFFCAVNIGQLRMEGDVRDGSEFMAFSWDHIKFSSHACDIAYHVTDSTVSHLATKMVMNLYTNARICRMQIS